jgi:PEP-CTERM motif-containing protein
VRQIPVLFLLLTAAVASANTFVDPFNQSQASGCSYSFSYPFSSCDIIGDPSLFDIQKADVSIRSSLVTVTIYMNYPNNSASLGVGTGSLGGFEDGIHLEVGDLLFFNPADGLTNYGGDAYPKFIFGVPLTSHDGLTAGDLYSVNPTTLLTADDKIHNGGYYYRRSNPVWLPAGASHQAHGNGITVQNSGNGVTSAKYAITVGFVPTSAFLTDTGNGGSFGISVENAFCANDVLVGSIGPVPEPGTIGMMIGGGLVLVGLIRRRNVSGRSDDQSFSPQRDSV